MRIVTEKEQLNAMIAGDKYSLVCSALNKTELTKNDYDRVFTVSFCRAAELIKAEYSIEDIAETRLGKSDGYYAIPISNGWNAYYQEKGIPFNEEFLTSEKQLIRHYCKYWLGLWPGEIET